MRTKENEALAATGHVDKGLHADGVIPLSFTIDSAGASRDGAQASKPAGPPASSRSGPRAVRARWCAAAKPPWIALLNLEELIATLDAPPKGYPVKYEDIQM